IGAIENSEGNFKEADAVEERTARETSRRPMRSRSGSWRRCGCWGGRRCRDGPRTRSKRRNEKFVDKLRCIAKVKKLRWHTKFGEVAVLEPQYRFEKKRVRPFMRSAKVVSRGCSGPLQRAIVDFAADQPFALARAKLREHYGFEIGESTIQRVTLGHAGNMFEAGKISLDFPEAPGRHKDIVAETDGGMIPIVEQDARQKDKRKGKTLSWREAKISLAHAKGSRTPIYAGAIEGGVETAGRQLLGCAVRAGFGADSRVHAVGDGAAWIVGQVEAQFGPQGGYLIDFYHVCEYLSAAVKAIAPDAAAKEAWMEAQKEALKTGHLEKTLQALARHLEPPQLADDQAPVRTCHRYLSGRKNQLDYRDALARDLPIGSGEIESAHRYIAQKRLKLPGAWWRVETPTPCSPCASPVSTATGTPIGASAAKTARPQIKTAPPYHKNPQHDCITLDRTQSLQHTVAEEVELDMVRGSLRPLQQSPIRTFDRGAQPPSNIQTDPSQVRVVGHGAFDEVMGNGIKEGFDVQIDDPVGRPAPFPRRPDRVKRRTARSIAVGVRMEPRLHQRLQDHLDDRLRHAVGNGRNAERPRAAVVRRRDPAGSRSSPGGTALPEWAPARI